MSRLPRITGAVVPAHAGETLGPGLLHKILRDCELTADQLAELL
jgi:predicted RNA binding protein YcfA (HicA-like mRNA interferase family)